MLAPIILFVYNRPQHTRRTIEALKKNKLASKSKLFIFSDAPKNKESIENVEKVRKYINTITGFKNITINEAKKNKGLANSVISGVTEIINKHGKVIVLEDDLVTSPNFLEYMNESLNFYEEDKRIWSISGYSLPIDLPRNYNKDVYLSVRSWSWGYATWKDRWYKVDWKVSDYNEFIKSKKKKKEFNMGGEDLVDMLKSQMNSEIDSWYIRWQYSQYNENSYCIYPRKSLVKNIGHDGTGVHCGKTEKFDVDLMERKIKLERNIKLNDDISKKLKSFNSPNLVRKHIIMLLKKLNIYSSIRRIKKGL